MMSKRDVKVKVKTDQTDTPNLAKNKTKLAHDKKDTTRALTYPNGELKSLIYTCTRIYRAERKRFCG